MTSPGSLARSASATTESRWYGWQTLATDGASLSLVAGGIALDVATEASPGLLAGSLIGLGVATYTLGGPIVHFAQGNPGRGFASLALRIGLPIVLGYGAVVTICGDNRDFCSLVAIPGGAVGIATAITLDAAALARDRVSVDATRSASGLIVVPTFRIDRQHAAVGLSGAF